MAVVRHYNQNAPERTWPNRPNSQTAVHLLSCIINIGAAVLKLSTPVALILNLPLRGLNISKALKNKDYFQSALNLVAIAFLFFPYGAWGAAAIDFTSELLFNAQDNLQRNTPKDPFSPQAILETRIDPNNWRNACRLLNVSEAEAADRELITQRYHFHLRELEERRDSVSGQLTVFIQQMIDDTTIAYQTLLAGSN